MDTTLLTEGFKEFLDFCKALGCEVAICTDGFGFYVQDILKSHFLPQISVICNEMKFGEPNNIKFPHSHPSCQQCGVCKRIVIENLRKKVGITAFVGDGLNDIYAAAVADVVFAKGMLVKEARRRGIDVIEWENFFDIINYLEEEVKLCKNLKSICPSK